MALEVVQPPPLARFGVVELPPYPRGGWPLNTQLFFSFSFLFIYLLIYFVIS